MANTVPLIGYAYEIVVSTTQGDFTVSTDTWSPEALRVTFDIEQHVLHSVWWATVCLYNPSAATASAFITQGCALSISAGYQNGQQYGQIFAGKIMRVMFDKEDVTDTRLIFQAVTGMDVYLNALTSMATGPFQTQQQIIAQMADPNNTKGQNFQLGTTSAKLANGQLPCPKVIFGAPGHYIENFARQHNLLWNANASELFVQDLETTTANPSYTYSTPIPLGSNLAQDPGTNYTIIGTPQQIDRGIVFRVQMDARLRAQLPMMAVKIDNTVIRQQGLNTSQLGQVPPILSKDGIYGIIGLRYVGDNWGQTWFTEIQGVITNGTLLSLGIQDGQDIRNQNQVN